MAEACQPEGMTTAQAIALLDKFRSGQVGREAVLHAFQNAPLVDLGFAQPDLQRSLRKNFPEVIYGAGKSPAQVVAIATEIRALTEWSATADHDLALSISAQVIPALARALQMAAAAADSDAARQVAAIGALAAGERDPIPVLSFG